VERDTARVSFLRLGAAAMEVEVVAYVETRKGAEFLKIQEELLIQIMDCVESAGVKLATPSSTIVVESTKTVASNGPATSNVRTPAPKGE
jgi:MscS family membrane protein